MALTSPAENSGVVDDVGRRPALVPAPRAARRCSADHDQAPQPVAGVIGVLSALAVALAVAVVPASAITFQRDRGQIALPHGSSCPTIDTPAAYEAWFNLDDMERRGFWDPKDNSAWDYSKKLSQVICGAAPRSEIKIGMFFIRALGTMSATPSGTVPRPIPSWSTTPWRG